MNFQSKGIFSLVGIIIIAFAILATGGIFAYQKLWVPKEEVVNTQQQKACTQEAKVCPDGSAVGRTGPNCEFAQCPSSETDETAGWKTYTNTQYGFEIKYPSDNPFSFHENVSNSGYTAFNLNGFQIIIHPYNDSLDVWAKGSINMDIGEKYSKKINFLGKDAYEFANGGLGDSLSYTIATKSQGYLYEISFPGRGRFFEDGILSNLKAKLTTEQNQILSTFKFIETTAVAPYIKVIFPNGGEVLALGNTYNITWQSSEEGTAKIYLQFSENENICNNKSSCSCYIGEAPISTKNYAWKIDGTKLIKCDKELKEGKYKINITLDKWWINDFDSKYVDESDNYFSITQ